MAGQTPKRSKQLSDAIESLITTYGDMDLMAKTMIVNADEVATELASVGDTSERVALLLLQKYNTKQTNDNNDPEHE